jgi:spectinomycin phosphotransferase
MILYPFIEGKDGYEVNLTEAQWVEFGAAVKRIHLTELPSELLHQVRREDYNPLGRNRVKGFQAQVDSDAFIDSTAARLAAFMCEKQTEISQLVGRAERLASELQTREMDFVLCHSDLHAGNLHITPDGQVYIVDWDNPILAPKEHDLMHIGASARWNGRVIKRLFFQGYGEARVDGMAIAYYRCERIIQDIAEFCSQLLSTTAGGEDREQSLAYFMRQFEPGQEVEIACRGGTETQRQFYACFTPRTR